MTFSATSIRFQPTAFTVTLADGRAIAIPLAFYPTLAQATPAQRKDWTLLNNGRGISWDALNLDLSVQALLEGAREGIPQPPPLIKLKSARSSHA